MLSCHCFVNAENIFTFLLQVIAVIIINVAYCIPFFLDKQLHKIKNEDNSTSLVRSNSALGNSNLYQWLYKTILFYVIMYGMPLIMLAVFTGFLLTALTKARINRERMTGQNVSFFFIRSIKLTDTVQKLSDITRMHSSRCVPTAC